MDVEEAIKLLKEMQENCKTKKTYKDDKAEAKAEAIEVVLEELSYLRKANEELKEKKDNIERSYQDYRILSVGIAHLELLIREARVISEAEERDEKTKEYYKTRLKCLLDLYSELYNSKTVLDYIPKDLVIKKIQEQNNKIITYSECFGYEEAKQCNYCRIILEELLEED